MVFQLLRCGSCEFCVGDSKTNAALGGWLKRQSFDVIRLVFQYKLRKDAYPQFLFYHRQLGIVIIKYVFISGMKIMFFYLFAYFVL